MIEVEDIDLRESIKRVSIQGSFLKMDEEVRSTIA
jgi:hypothetical protein